MARKQIRALPRSGNEPIPEGKVIASKIFATSTDRVRDLAHEARTLLANGKFGEAQEAVIKIEDESGHLSETSQDFISEQALIRILASAGAQLSSFIHEINSLVGTVQSLDNIFLKLKSDLGLDNYHRKILTKIHSIIIELRLNLERQASYLLDIITPDARRRRARQSLAERVESGKKLVAHTAQKRAITIQNEIPSKLKSPPMFPAELTMIFSNLLTNAIKAAGEGGKIRAFATGSDDDKIILIIENTGVSVDLKDCEKWFRPFESTTTEVDPVLGQGMGLGLTITRRMLDEYGAEVCFVKPTKGFSTAVAMTFPR